MLTKVFKSGNSQAVRLPKEFQIHSKDVEIFRRDGYIVIRENPENLVAAFDLLTQFPKDFNPRKRKDKKPQKRDTFE